MNYATNFAIVKDGVVTNVLWGMVYNADEFPGAVQVDDLAVEAGDTYVDGVFYHGGTPVRTRTEIRAELQEALDILLGGEPV